MLRIKKIFLLSLLFVSCISESKSVLITGGGGYIGSHAAVLLHEKGYEVIILDQKIPDQIKSWAICEQGDYGSTDMLEKIFGEHTIDAVMHFAAFIEVGGSVKDPLSYYENNVCKTVTLLQMMLKHGIKKFIFSSSCAVYGIPDLIPITENEPRKPISPYGNTKYMIELILEDVARQFDFTFVALRYFNACGATPAKNLGECHNPETHLIPLLLRAADAGSVFNIFGDDYPTPDGTCIRDYIHVQDLARAHWLALEYLNNGGKSDYFNLGSGSGISVRSVLETVESVTGKKINVRKATRRPGDPAILTADASKAQHILHWQPQKSSLLEIVKDAYDFVHKK